MFYFLATIIMLNTGLMQRSMIGVFQDEDSCKAYASGMLTQLKQNAYVQIIDAACKSEDQIKGTKI